MENIRKKIRKLILEHIGSQKLYIAPNNTIVYRANKGKNISKLGSFFSLDKGTAEGYLKPDLEIIKKDISNKKFIYSSELKNYKDEMIKKYPFLFEFDPDINYYGDLLNSVNKTEFYSTISSLLKEKGFQGIISDDNYEIFVF